MHRGVWNVPFVSSVLLFAGKWLQELGEDLPLYNMPELDCEMSLAMWMRQNVSIQRYLEKSISVLFEYYYF